MSEIENLLAEILRVSCRCDAKLGYACPVHVPLGKLRELLSPARGDGQTECSTHEDSDGTGYCCGCGVTIGEPHHRGCLRLPALYRATPTPPSAEGEEMTGGMMRAILRNDPYCRTNKSDHRAPEGWQETQGEVKFKVDGQWYKRGNKSPAWFAIADRLDDSLSGIAERLPSHMWPFLEEIARLAAPVSTERMDVRKLYDELLLAVSRKWPGESRHDTALRYIRAAEQEALSPQPQEDSNAV